MVWRELYTQARIKTGVSPVETKDDLYEIMSFGIKQLVSADAELKDAMQLFLKPYAFKEEKSADAYKWMAMIPAIFIQWLAEKKKRPIKLSDLDYPILTPEDANLFADEYSDSENVRAHVRSALIKFFKFMTMRDKISKYPFPGLKVDMPKGVRVVVYDNKILDEFYNMILLGKEDYYTLFWKLVLQTGARPGQIFPIRCGDIGKKPSEDALGRKFYSILHGSLLDREKKIVKEAVYKKKPAEVVYISESLRDGLLAWCEKNNLKPNDYIFKSIIKMDAIQEGIRRTAKRLEERLSEKRGYYIMYGLRHTWASVIYNVTGFDIKYLQTAGGWEGVGIPLGTYTALMKGCEAMNVAQKWEIFLPVHRKEEIIELKEKCERKEVERVPGVPAVSTEQFEDLKALVETLRNQLAVALKKPR